jgi:hypothetical protein
MAGAEPASGGEAAEAVCCGSGGDGRAAGIAGLAEKGAGGGTEGGAVADAACSDAASGGAAGLGGARAAVSGCGMEGDATVDACCPEMSGLADAETAGCGAADGAAAAPGADPLSVATAVGGGDGSGNRGSGTGEMIGGNAVAAPDCAAGAFTLMVRACRTVLAGRIDAVAMSPPAAARCGMTGLWA